MAVTLPKKDLSLGQLKFIRICCTFFVDPISKEKQLSKKLLEGLRNDKTVPSVAIDFALTHLFGPLDPILVKYLSKKLYNGNKYQYGDSEKIKPPIEMFISTKDMVSVPLMLGNLLTGKLHNLERRFKERSFKFTGKLRPYQEEIIPTFEKHLNTLGTTIVGLYPGFGKTIIGAYLCSGKKLLTCVLIHLSTLINQWKNTFELVTNAKIWIVGENGFEESMDDIDVIICMEERLSKIPESLRNKIGTVIIDEAHAFCTPSRVRCWFLEPKYLILETATLKRPDDAMERMAYASCGYWGLFIPSKKKFDVIPVMTGIKPPGEKNKQGGIDWNKRVKFLLSHELRNHQILEIVKKELSEDGKILILTPQVEHVNCLAKVLKLYGHKASTYCRNDKVYTDASILIGTLSKIGTAFDEATACPTFNGQRINVLILCMTIRKPTLLEQCIGREMRAESPRTYVFLDDDISAKDHWNLMKWWFKGYTNADIGNVLDLSSIIPDKVVKLIINSK